MRPAIGRHAAGYVVARFMGMYMVGVLWFGPVFVVGSRSRLGLTSAVLCLCLSECSGCLRKSGLAVHAGLRLKRSAFFS